MHVFHIFHGIQLAELAAPKSFLDKTVGELDLRKRFNVNIIALQKENGDLDPLVKVDTVIHEGDLLLLIGKNDSLEQVSSLA